MLNELGWVKGFDGDHLRESNRSVISTTLAVHDARPVQLLWDPTSLDLSKLRLAVDAAKLTGTPTEHVEALFEEVEPWDIPVDLMEKLLIRATLHTGTLIANAQHAGQWETQVGNETDTLGRIIAVLSGHLAARFPMRNGD